MDNPKQFELKGTEGTWHGREIQTDTADSTPMVDGGTGKPYILRQFEFAINPQVNKELKDKKIKVSRQELFNTHWPQIRTSLWSDGLVASTDVEPRVLVGKKAYKIILLCEPKLRTMVAERPTTLQQVFKH